MSTPTTTGKLIGYARVSTAGQDAERQELDILAAGVRKDDLYVDQGASGARASRPALDAARKALQAGDTLIIATLDRLGRSTENMLNLSKELKAKGVALRVLNLGGENVDTSTPTGEMMFTVMAALAQMEYDIKAERNRDSAAKRKANGQDLGGRRKSYDDDIIHGIMRDIEAGMSVSAAAGKRGMNRATYYRRKKELGES